jgi:hypothetical protein
MTRGKSYVQYFELDDQIYNERGEHQQVLMYFIIYPNNSTFMKQRILKLSDTYNSSIKMERFELGRTR